MTRVKICGLCRVKDAEYVNEAKPDYAGFVFWDKSRRNLSFQEAEKLRSVLDPEIKTIGVFVNRDVKDIEYLTKKGIISGVQLHGSETEEDIEAVRNVCPEGTFIIKAFEVRNKEDVKRANGSKADMILIDSGKGSGNLFDWKLLDELKRDYILAGGLDPENVKEAVRTYHPFAVDVSSRVETDGCKDQKKILDFCNAAREII